MHYEAYDWERDGSGGLAKLVGSADALLLCWAPSRGGGGGDRRRHYIDGARTVLEGCELGEIGRIVYTSSTSALPALDAELDESCDEWPTSERGMVQREAEEVIVRGAGAGGIPWTILRLAGLHGPGRDLERIYCWEEGIPLSGDGSSPTNFVHLEDVCRAIVAALGLLPSISGVVHVCGDDHASRREVFAEMARRQGRPEPTWEQPEAPPRGKRVANLRLGTVLGVDLAHPSHVVAS